MTREQCAWCFKFDNYNCIIPISIQRHFMKYFISNKKRAPEIGYFHMLFTLVLIMAFELRKAPEVLMALHSHVTLIKSHSPKAMVFVIQPNASLNQILRQLNFLWQTGLSMV